jgi:penicillin-binding protein 1A
MQWKKLLKILTISIAVFFIILTTFLATLFLGGFGKIPSEAELENLKNESASVVYSREGQLIGKFYAKNRTNVAYDSLPPFLVEQLIATEDARFYEHEGVDSKSLLRVLIKTLLMGDKSAGGGSTLSQQLAKNLFGRKDYGRISLLVNKLKEIILANRLENIYSKEEIVQLYLNTVPFGENVFGIEAASQRFFSASVQDLKMEESAILIGLLKANSYYNPRNQPEHALERRNVVLNQCRKYAYLSQQQYDSLSTLPLTLHYSNLSKDGIAPYFMEQVKGELKTILEKVKLESNRSFHPEKDGLVIHTSLNVTLQNAALKAMKKHLSRIQPLLRKSYEQGRNKQELLSLCKKVAKLNKVAIDSEKRKSRQLFHWEEVDQLTDSLSVQDSLQYVLTQLHAGILGLNPQNGAIETWVGGINFSAYPYDQILAKRQLASTFKPFLYAEAIRSGKQACDYLNNEEIVLSDYADWSPQNYDGTSGGKYSLAAALALSKNLPTVQLYFETDWEKLEELWSELGFIEKLNEDPSVIFGTNSVSMLELATAYSAFANNGLLIEPYTIEKVFTESGELLYEHKTLEKKRVLDEKSTAIMNEILMKAINEGTGTAIRNTYHLNIPLAGKTGTSQNYADAWFVSYNRSLVLLSRVGASYPVIHFHSGSLGSGSKLALPLVAYTFQEALMDDEFNQEMRRANLKHSKTISCDDFKENTGLENFLNKFKNKSSNLEKERERSERKKNRKKFFKKLFNKEEE